MRKSIGLRVLSACALMSMASVIAADENFDTRSYFSVRSFADALVPQNLVLDQAHKMGKADKQRNMQFNVFASHSTESEKLARYFLQGKTFLIVNEAAPAGNNGTEQQQDVLSRDMNIITNEGTYTGELKASPVQHVYGGTLSLRSYMGEKQQWSWAIEVPLVYVRNDMRLTEDTGGKTFTASNANWLDQQNKVVGNMIDAFKQEGMKYGKVDGVRHKGGVGNIVLKVGYEPCSFCDLDDKYMNMYAGIILPSDRKPEAIYMFEPVLGNGGHTGIVTGTEGEYLMKSGKSYNFWSRWNIESRYLFENTQKRSLDLLGNGVWSRYLAMYENLAMVNAQTPTFGINLLTRDVKVRPGYQCMIDGTFYLTGERWHASLGLTTFARQSERVKLAQEWTTAPYIASYNVVGDTNRTRQSGRQYVNNDAAGADIAIKESDLDLNSCAHPATVSQMIYATVGGYKEAERPCMYEVGASYEVSCMNTSLNRWGVWGTLQYSF